MVEWWYLLPVLIHQAQQVGTLPLSVYTLVSVCDLEGLKCATTKGIGSNRHQQTLEARGARLGGLTSSPWQELHGLLTPRGLVSRLGHSGFLDAQVPAFLLVQLAQVVVVAALVELVEDAVFCESIFLGVDVSLGVHADVEARLHPAYPHLSDVVRGQLQDGCMPGQSDADTFLDSSLTQSHVVI